MSYDKKYQDIYEAETKNARINLLTTDDIKVKLLLIFNLLFMIVVIGYFIFSTSSETTIYKKTKVLGVSYVADEDKILEEQLNGVEVDTLNDTINNGIRYNTVDAKDEGYTHIRTVDSKNDGYTHIRTVDSKDDGYKNIRTVDSNKK